MSLFEAVPRVSFKEKHTMSKISNFVNRAAQEVKTKATEAKQEIKQKADEAGATKQGQFAKDAFEHGKSVVFSREGWGVSIGVDDGVHPRRFGYGEKGKTIAETPKSLWTSEKHERRAESITRPGTYETVSTTTDEAGVHGRLFGDLNAKTLSAKLGVEGEAGFKSTVEEYGTKTESFLGTRGRAYVEGGPLGQTAGAEVFAGLDVHKQTGEEKGAENWGVMTEQGTVGARWVAKAHVGPSSSVMSRAEVGAGYRFQYQEHQKLIGDVGHVGTAAMDFFVGAKTGIEASMGPTGAGAKAEAFVGAKVGLEGREAIAYAGQELIGAQLRGEGWVGLGAKAEASVGIDLEKRAITANASAGAAVVVGGSVDVGVTVAGDRLFGKGKDGGEADAANEHSVPVTRK
ncbi:MAG: hypothetical protein QM817_04540 [Archangium sp.]